MWMGQIAPTGSRFRKRMEMYDGLWIRWIQPGLLSSLKIIQLFDIDELSGAFC